VRGGITRLLVSDHRGGGQRTCPEPPTVFICQTPELAHCSVACLVVRDYSQVMFQHRTHMHALTQIHFHFAFMKVHSTCITLRPPIQLIHIVHIVRNSMYVPPAHTARLLTNKQTNQGLRAHISDMRMHFIGATGLSGAGIMAAHRAHIYRTTAHRKMIAHARPEDAG
jgi:hypothetical protein